MDGSETPMKKLWLFLYFYKQGVRGHKADSHCPVSEPLAIQEGQASFLEECLPAYRADGLNLNSPDHSCKRLSSPHQDIWLSTLESEQRGGFPCQIKWMVHITS